MEDGPEKMCVADKIRRMESFAQSGSDLSASGVPAYLRQMSFLRPKAARAAQKTTSLVVLDSDKISTSNEHFNRTKSALETFAKDIKYHLTETMCVPVTVQETHPRHETKHVHLEGDRRLPDKTEYSNTANYQTGEKAGSLAKELQDAVDSQIDLLMLGKTGNGKSTLGNSILCRDAFESAASATSVTKLVQYEVSEFNGRIIKVVDGPGVSDTDWEKDETTNFVIDALSHAITINPSGYHAFLLVVKFGNRFGKDDLGTINYLKTIFGKNFVRNYCILVMTFGDQFQEKVTFDQWLKSQNGVLADIVKKCNDRVILFDNKTKDEEKKHKQIENLVEIVDKLRFANSRYSNDQFELARSERDVLILTSKKPVIVDETMNEVGIIVQKFKQAQETVKKVNNTVPLKMLLERTKRLYSSVVAVDNKSGVLADLVVHIHSIQSSINDEINLCHRIREIKEDLEKASQLQIKKLTAELTTMKEKYEKHNSAEKRLEADLIRKLELEIEHRKEQEEQWRIEALEKSTELHVIMLRTRELEEQYRNVKRKNAFNFGTIVGRVAKTFKKRPKVQFDEQPDVLY